MTIAEKQTLFLSILQTHRPFFFTLIQKRLAYSTPEDQEDILQQAAINGYNKLEQWDDGKGQLSTWLGTIVNNEARNWHRATHAQKRDQSKTFSIQQKLLGDGEEYNKDIDFTFSLDSYDDTKEIQQQLILESIEEMSSARREIIQLSYIQQLTVAEIAALKQCSYSCATSKINQATAILREKVQRKWRQLQ